MTTTTKTDIDLTLAERGAQYGEFKTHAHITILIKRIIAGSPRAAELTPSQTEALHMIAHKIGRIVNGNPNHIDSWTDIAGYARLVETELLEAEQKGAEENEES